MKDRKRWSHIPPISRVLHFRFSREFLILLKRTKRKTVGGNKRRFWEILVVYPNKFRITTIQSEKSTSSPNVAPLACHHQLLSNRPCQKSRVKLILRDAIPTENGTCFPRVNYCIMLVDCFERTLSTSSLAVTLCTCCRSCFGGWLCRNTCHSWFCCGFSHLLSW